ncbi:hypothetical protein MTBBW1_340042 [Desulfamplus magnetovallimortis]|uniref:Uncharacterized protein n=1 Tax=Desulfamplus magnetovallimortis TaxID=1246637 RepID=A0A1W1HG91_9BACT|nr:DUF1850 domain-containing protein [Desulfamplus magnetovallimortis]SLM31490.1 hypothetical protein MTBBW1_340042 [Desulfamplus magnetovallimortis]
MKGFIAGILGIFIFTCISTGEEIRVKCPGTSAPGISSPSPALLSPPKETETKEDRNSVTSPISGKTKNVSSQLVRVNALISDKTNNSLISARTKNCTTCGHLVITEFPVKKVLGRYPLDKDQTFALTFIHSVSKTRVKDIFEIRSGQIIQTKEFFQTHGAGLPSAPDEPGGTSWEKTSEGFILNMERPIIKLVVRTDSLYENRLVLPSGTLNLNQWGDQAILIFFEKSI